MNTAAPSMRIVSSVAVKVSWAVLATERSTPPSCTTSDSWLDGSWKQYQLVVAAPVSSTRSISISVSFPWSQNDDASNAALEEKLASYPPYPVLAFVATIDVVMLWNWP